MFEFWHSFSLIYFIIALFQEIDLVSEIASPGWEYAETWYFECTLECARGSKSGSDCSSSSGGSGIISLAVTKTSELWRRTTTWRRRCLACAKAPWRFIQFTPFIFVFYSLNHSSYYLIHSLVSRSFYHSFNNFIHSFQGVRSSRSFIH